MKEGGLSEEVINDRVRDILRVKFLIGLFDAPYQTDLAGADREVEKEENEAIALQASRESIVLLKNAGELLPLDINSTKKIAVCGPNANEEGYALTHYGPLAVEVTTVLEGIQEKTKGKAEVLYTKGCDLVDAHWPESEIIDYPLTDDEQAEIDKAVENARQADVAIVVLGGGQRTCGENKSRTSLDLPGRQLQLLRHTSHGQACRTDTHQRTPALHQLGRQVRPRYPRSLVSRLQRRNSPGRHPLRRLQPRWKADGDLPQDRRANPLQLPLQTFFTDRRR